MPPMRSRSHRFTAPERQDGRPQVTPAVQGLQRGSCHRSCHPVEPDSDALGGRNGPGWNDCGNREHSSVLAPSFVMSQCGLNLIDGLWSRA